MYEVRITKCLTLKSRVRKNKAFNKNVFTLFHGFKQKHEEENNIYSNHDKANLASNELNKEKKVFPLTIYNIL